MLRRSLCALLVFGGSSLSLLSGCATETEAVIEERQDLFVKGDAGYPTFRIPALIEAPNGVVLAFAEGRHSGILDSGDIDIVVRRSTDGGRTFGPIEVVVDAGIDTAGNPAPVVDRATGDIVLPYCTNPASDMNARSVHVIRSHDGGQTWDAPVDITSDVKPANLGWFATGPGRSLQMRSGRFVVPCDSVDDSTGVQQSNVIVSDDGVHWTLGASLGPDLDESQVVELANGSLLISMRDNSTRHQRAFARSDDGGLTFGTVYYDDRIPDPSCEGSMITTPRGLLHSNPASDEYLSRSRLTVRLSPDEGATWRLNKLVEPGPAAYSSLATTPDGQILVLYETGNILPYDRITLARVSFAYLATPDSP